jgi:hypothetical protein
MATVYPPKCLVILIHLIHFAFLRGTRISQVAKPLEFPDFQPRRLGVAGAQQQGRKDLTPTQQVGPIPGQRHVLIQSKLVHVHGTSQFTGSGSKGIHGPLGVPEGSPGGEVSGIDILKICKIMLIYLRYR